MLARHHALRAASEYRSPACVLLNTRQPSIITLAEINQSTRHLFYLFSQWIQALLLGFALVLAQAVENPYMGVSYTTQAVGSPQGHSPQGTAYANAVAQRAQPVAYAPMAALLNQAAGRALAAGPAYHTATLPFLAAGPAYSESRSVTQSSANFSNWQDENDGASSSNRRPPAHCF